MGSVGGPERQAPDVLERMTGGELQTVRESLGLSQATLAALLQVREDTVAHWERGRDPIPERVRLQVEELERMTDATVRQVVETLKDAQDPSVVVYRTAKDVPADRPDVARMGARWWRHVVYRATRGVSGVVIGTPKELEAWKKARQAEEWG